MNELYEDEKRVKALSMRIFFRFQSLGRLHHHKLDFNHKSKVRALFTVIIMIKVSHYY